MTASADPGSRLLLLLRGISSAPDDFCLDHSQEGKGCALSSPQCFTHSEALCKCFLTDCYPLLGKRLGSPLRILLVVVSPHHQQCWLRTDIVLANTQMVVRFPLLTPWIWGWATVPKDGWGEGGCGGKGHSPKQLWKRRGKQAFCVAGILCSEAGKPFARRTAKSPALQLSACQRDLSGGTCPGISCHTETM